MYKPMKSDSLGLIPQIDQGKIPQFDFHVHTKWTDGENTSLELYEKAVSLGLECILFSEHARKSSEEWFPAFAREIRSLPKSPCKALVGVETKVENFEGDLDCTPLILNECDLVMASVHRFPGEKGIVREFSDVMKEEAVETEFALANAILDHPAVDILGHPFGMCYRRFGVKPPFEKIRLLMKKAAEKNIAFEINAHYHPDPWNLIHECQKLGTKISLGSNVHQLDDLGKITRILEETKSQ